MKVKKVIITNFKSIEGPLELDFDRMQGFWKIGGDVGAGKTSIGEAVLFGLFGTIKGKNNTDLVTWGKKKGFLEVYCESKNHDIYIKREFRLQGQSQLYVTVDGSEIVFTNKRDAQSQLEEEYFDVSRMTLELLCIISFNNFKSLATLNAADSKAFLDQVFGFYMLTEYGNVCKEMKGEVDNNILSINHNISSIQAQIDKILQLSQIEKIEGDINELENHVTTQKTIIVDNKKILSDLYKRYQSESSTLSQEIGEIVALGKAKAKEIDFIKKGVCPTCGAPIDQSHLELKEKEKEVLTKSYIEKNNKLKEIQSIYADKKCRIEKIIEDANRLIIEDNNIIIKLQEQEKRLNINTKEVDDLNIQKEEQQELLERQEKDSNEWKSLYNILTNDVRQKILSSFIPLLNQSISHYTKQLGLPYIITFDDAFKCNICLINNQKVPIACLSTGQLKTVDISIILGVLRTITSNVNFSLYFLDELFSNMHESLREDMCNVLKSNIKPGQTIFVISHVYTKDEYFDGVIEAELEYKDGLPRSNYSFRK